MYPRKSHRIFADFFSFVFRKNFIFSHTRKEMAQQEQPMKTTSFGMESDNLPLPSTSFFGTTNASGPMPNVSSFGMGNPSMPVPGGTFGNTSGSFSMRNPNGSSFGVPIYANGTSSVSGTGFGTNSGIECGNPSFSANKDPRFLAILPLDHHPSIRWFFQCNMILEQVMHLLETFQDLDPLSFTYSSPSFSGFNSSFANPIPGFNSGNTYSSPYSSPLFGGCSGFGTSTSHLTPSTFGNFSSFGNIAQDTNDWMKLNTPRFAQVLEECISNGKKPSPNRSHIHMLSIIEQYLFVSNLDHVDEIGLLFFSKDVEDLKNGGFMAGIFNVIRSVWSHAPAEFQYYLVSECIGRCKIPK